jgi:hypothetical protein
MFVQLIGQVGLDLVGDELPLAVLEGAPFLQTTADLATRDHHFLDLAILDELLEFAVGQGGDGLHTLPDVMQQHQAEHGNDDVRDTEPRPVRLRWCWRHATSSLLYR